MAECLAHKPTFADGLRMTAVGNLKPGTTALKEFAAGVSALLLDALAFFDAAFPANRVADCVKVMFDEYPDLTFADYVIFFKSVKSGTVKSPSQTYKLHEGETFGKPTPAKIVAWLRTFYHAKIDARERANDNRNRHIGEEWDGDTAKKLARIFAGAVGTPPPPPKYGFDFSAAGDDEIRTAYLHSTQKMRAEFVKKARDENRTDVLKLIQELSNSI